MAERFTGTLEYHLTQDYNQRGLITNTQDRLDNLRVAIREIVSNAKDGKTFFDWETGQDSVLSVGVTNVQRIGPIFRSFNRGQIDDRALLMGWSNKRTSDVRGIIGQFGEGLKLAMITACRLGISMVVRVGDVEWRPTLEPSSKFQGETVLYVRSKKLDPDKFVDGTEVRLYPIEPTLWDEEKPKFRFLNPTGKEISTTYGVLLLEPRDKGKIFVNGVLDHVQEDFIFGYDLTTVPKEEINRDRHLIASHIIKQHTSDVLAQAIQKSEMVATQLVKAMSETSFRSIEGGYISWENKGSLKPLADAFRKMNPHEVPISEVDKVERVKSAGRQPIVVSSALISILTKAEGDDFFGLDKVEQLINSSYSEEVEFKNLPPTQKYNVLRAFKFLSMAVPELGGDTYAEARRLFRFVAFNTPKQGLYIVSSKERLISLTILDNPRQLIETMVHEWAHEKGTDGTVEFEKECDRLHSAILMEVVAW